MNRSLFGAVTMTALLALPLKPGATPDDFRLNQVGFYPQARKLAVVLDTNATEFQILKVSNSEVVYTGQLSATMKWTQSGESGKQAVFTDFNTPGEYMLKVESLGTSHPFVISGRALKEAAHASLKSYYYQRCSFELTEEFAGQWARPLGHPDTLVPLHSSLGVNDTISAPYGWYDAGDYGKYIVNSGISTGTLLALYELFPEYFGDQTNIPESGNNKSDLLDEIKFNLDWMKAMQDADGGVFFKLTTAQFSGMVLPHRDKATRYAIGKSTTSALDFASVLAMAGRVFKSYDETYATECTEQAEKAWAWAKQNPSVSFSNPTGVNTGGYGDAGDYSDEFLWAATELMLTTGKSEYKDFVAGKDARLSGAPSWQSVYSMATLSLATRENDLPAAKLDSIKNSVTAAATSWSTQISNSLYHVPNASFNWGSNSNFANIGMIMVHAYKITGDENYIQTAAEIADYLLGKNATTYSFMTGIGTKTPMHIHHRPSEGDNVEDPVPGLIAGGPNSGRQDAGPNVVYPYTEPARSYVDVEPSYASNEVAINWNAPTTFLLAAIDAILGDDALPIQNRTSNGAVSRLWSRSAADGVKLTFSLSASDNVEISVYNMKGSLVNSMKLGVCNKGSHSVNLGRSSLANGSYLVKVKAGKQEMITRIQPVK